jgi:alanyl-tRNA synthetase
VKTPELRKLYLDYFVTNDHLLVPSSSLVPHRDPSVLLTTAGMQQFKPYYLGVAEPPSRRMCSVQKCFRTTDIDRVGHTSRHCTFFEMLGNFAIGDYFKEGAIRFGMEFSLDYLGFPKDRLWVSVFEGDDQVEPDGEAMDAWESVGIPRSRMVPLPRSENFWGPAGPTGPCGPCSELYYDRGPEFGCGRPDCKPGCECDRFLEYWNLVFTQYDQDEHGGLSPLPASNIDTGMGLERVAALTQNVESVYMTDMFHPLVELGQELAGHRLGEDPRADVALRVVADHSRAMSFLIADGVLPGNEGRGYVLRRVIRRAARLSRNAQMEPPFLGRFAERVIEMLGGAYPELVDRRDTILRIVNAEEERFNRTLDQGLLLLEQEVQRAREAGSAVLPGATAFMLHDTYGFPVEVTRELVEEKGLRLDMGGFESAMEEQRERARSSQKGGEHSLDALVSFARSSSGHTEFVGYEQDELFTVVDSVEPLEGGRVLMSLRESPFYSEMGGQTADLGWIESDTGRAEVLDVQLHGEVQVVVTRLVQGTIEPGTRVKAAISTVHRHSVAANHTGTHLLHYALRATLGKDVTQAGSAVRADKLRFDFAYHEPLGPRRIEEIESIVNRKIVEDHPVRTFTTSLEHAKDLGAMALFGEKYGDFVRVVEVDDFSRELCGGTHVGRTSELGLMKIVSEASVGANVRRIEAVTGKKAVEYYRARDAVLARVAGSLGSQEDQVLPAVEKLQARLAAVTQELKELQSGKTRDAVQELADGAIPAGAARVVVSRAAARDMEHLLDLVDHVRDRVSPAVVVLGAEADGKALFVVSATKGLPGIHAGDLAKEAARTLGGGGGGSPTLGRAGGGDPALLEDALAAAHTAVLSLLGG